MGTAQAVLFRVKVLEPGAFQPHSWRAWVHSDFA